MKTSFFTVLGLILINNEIVVFDFSSSEKSGQWYVVNDAVMGGLSKSKFILNPNATATFTGNVTLENNGGFASVRTLVKFTKQENYKGVALRVKGDGNLYSVRFRTDNNFDGYAYQSKIKTEKNKWTEYKIPFEDFVPTYRGYNIKNKPALQSKNIAQMGLLIADKQSGDFEISIDWIKFYK